MATREELYSALRTIIDHCDKTSSKICSTGECPIRLVCLDRFYDPPYSWDITEEGDKENG